jgi:hypothetical protein
MPHILSFIQALKTSWVKKIFGPPLESRFVLVSNILENMLGTSSGIKLTVENTEWAIKNGKSKETGNIGYKRRRKTK